MNSRIAAISLCTVLLFGCTGKPPEIARVFQQSTVVEDLEQNQITFQQSLFVQAEDPDGTDDLEELFLISDEHELFWSLNNETWTKTGAEDAPWIGSNAITMPDGRPLPPGKYRVLLRDIGGGSVERTLSLPERSLQQIRKLIPRVTIEKDLIKLDAGEQTPTLWLYDSSGNFFRAAVVEIETSVAELTKQFPNLKQGFSFQVYVYNQDQKIGLRTGPYTVQP